jgi:hypothetical protein
MPGEEVRPRDGVDGLEPVDLDLGCEEGQEEPGCCETASRSGNERYERNEPGHVLR